MKTQTRIIASPPKWETFVRTEKHLNDNGTSSDVVVESRLPCGPNVNDGTGAAYWIKHGYTIKTVWDAEQAAKVTEQEAEILPQVEVIAPPVSPLSKKGKKKDDTARE